MNMFEDRYRRLNAAQKLAVDTTEGPVMVVAGPGTGKTELLSMRVANILKQTDVLPQNILCLTFTESGATAMRERLVGLLGPSAYKVAIHTFHSFGAEIINYHGQYFYQGAHFRAADELSSYEVLAPLLEALPHSNPLAGKMNGAFTHLRDLQTTISDLKKSGLTPDELDIILDRNDAFCDWIQPQLDKAFGDRLSKKSFDAIRQLLIAISEYHEDPVDLISYNPLSDHTHDTLEYALSLAETQQSTKPLSAWKKLSLEKDERDMHRLKDTKRSHKLRAASKLYYSYLTAMQERSLYDFDDMILRVVHALEVFDELRYNLQEHYQYILVDEFQDTNDAQMRLLWNLTNNPVMNGSPNLMVVGDDDQAIYRFQGAKLSNIIDFRTQYASVAMITLSDNYRSNGDILNLARLVITQGTERLENTVAIDKTLTPHHESQHPSLICNAYVSEAEQYAAVAARIAKNMTDRPDASRAIIARNHRQLIAILPHLQQRDIPLRYERQEDVLESEPVQQLELLSRIVHLLSRQEFGHADELLPRLLAHPAWQLGAAELWSLSLQAHRSRQFWLETMLEQEGKLKDIAEWIIVCSHLAQHETLEYMLDILFGVVMGQSADNSAEEASEPFIDGPEEDFVSPLRAFFFPHDSLDAHPGRYLSHLSNLQKLRHTIREYRPDTSLRLADFIDCLSLHRELGLPIKGSGEVYGDDYALQLLTAHRSKGLEFDEVYIIDATDSIWGDGARARGKLIQFPSNLPIGVPGDTADERLRLFYVSLTRAKDQLYLSYASENSSGRSTLPVGALSGTDLVTIEEPASDTLDLIETLQRDWRSPLYDVPVTTAEQLLRPTLDRYRLSATHLNNFLDITKGGPELFLLQNLLRFPQAMSPSAAYGSAMHGALQRAHAHLAATKQRRPVEDVLHDFEELLSAYQLSDSDLIQYSQRGSDALSAYLAKRYDSFHDKQLVEQNFQSDPVMIGDACITGAIDLMDIDDEAKTIIVTDYKTGRPSYRWQGKAEYEKIKLHHFEQQLMLYKLLVEHSRQYAGYTVTSAVIEYVEPDERGDVIRLDYEFDEHKLQAFRSLIQAIWDRIMNLNFSVHEQYSPTIKGILEFEQSIVSDVDQKLIT